jgi:hypothetical protein
MKLVWEAKTRGSEDDFSKGKNGEEYGGKIG